MKVLPVSFSGLYVPTGKHVKTDKGQRGYGQEIHYYPFKNEFLTQSEKDNFTQRFVNPIGWCMGSGSATEGDCVVIKEELPFTEKEYNKGIELKQKMQATWSKMCGCC